MRGEDLHLMGENAILQWITPACAGKTSWWTPYSDRREDHPRMRGEDSGRQKEITRTPGSPPHARGRRAIDKGDYRAYGITPACAGKTHVFGGSLQS